MLGAINFYLDPDLSYTWRQASLLAAKAAGRGENHARNIRMWVNTYLATNTLPLHCYGHVRSSLLEDEDFASALKLHLLEKGSSESIYAHDLVDYVESPEVQAIPGLKGKKISERTARHWLHKTDWRYGRKSNGMYIDGHERADVVEYREQFVERFKEYEKRMVTYDNDGGILTTPTGFPVPQGPRFRLILVTHDESTFYANDRRKSEWIHASQKAVPQPKGDGASIMISDFLTSEWGWLRDNEDEARVVFYAGKNRDGYFTADDLLKQVDSAIDIFESKTNGMATGLFIFDNAPSHQKRAGDALSARKMPKNPKLGWTHHPKGPRMRQTVLADGSPQDLYFPDSHPTMPGWFKGMVIIIQERGLWPEGGLPAQCDKFKCKEGVVNCCCRRLLFTQPDFVSQTSALEELITSCGHICDFYPKYHCEINFVEQAWGAAKYRYRATPRTADVKEMERNVIACLDDIPLFQIRR